MSYENGILLENKCSFQINRDCFDDALRHFLCVQLKTNALSPPLGPVIDENYVETVGLAEFFRTTPSPLSVLLRQVDLQHYLLRPISEVEFIGDAYEPIFSKFERRIYNLAARNDETCVPYRYVREKRQNNWGDVVCMPDEQESIGHYFGTRRADRSVIKIQTDHLEAEADRCSDILPVHLANKHGATIRECLEGAVSHARQALTPLQCYVIQRRHLKDDDPNNDLHFGTLLAIMEGGPDPILKRIIFFDTIRNPSGEANWGERFKRDIDGVFPVGPGESLTSAMAEDGGVALWRPFHGKPKRHYDIDCSFHTFTMAKALIQIAREKPEILLNAHVDEVRSEMTARMPEYFHKENLQKSETELREAGINFRWATGREFLKQVKEAAHDVVPFPEAIVPLPDLLDRVPSFGKPKALVA
jgi:hypothetical protein